MFIVIQLQIPSIMKRTILKTLLVTTLIASFSIVDAQIQTSALNNRAIHEFGTAFNPLGKFAAFGESGGVIGPTATGCDLYGFRAQFTPDQAINIGMQNLSGRIIPTISTSTNLPLSIYQETTFLPTSALGCGSRLAFFGANSSNNRVFAIFGSATAFGGTWGTSDRKLKRDIQPIENALDIVSQLNGYTYEYRTEERPELGLPKGTRYGFITQEVQAVMPTVVRESLDEEGKPMGFQVMEYDAIMPVLAEAIKLQQNTITDLKGEVSELEGVVNELEQENRNLEARLARIEALLMGDKAAATTKPLDVNPSGVELRQNRPNPAKGTTAIEYTLPEDMTNANLVVFDLNGREISSQAINDQRGIVELSTKAWTSGTYIYSVVVDGRALARKKMIVQ